MHAALLIDDFFPSSGGIGCSVETQIWELADLGHWVSLIVPDRHLEKPRSCRVIECPTICVEEPLVRLNTLHNSERHTWLITRCARPDVMYTQIERGVLILDARVTRLQGISHPHAFHANVTGTHQTIKAVIFDIWLYQFLIDPLLTRATGRVSSRSRLVPRGQEPDGLAVWMDWASFAGIAGKVDTWTVPSPFMKNLAKTAAAHRVSGYVVPIGVGRGMLDTISQVRRERSNGTMRFMTVGQLARERRLGVLARTFRRADIPGSELVIVGDRDQRSLPKMLAADAGNIDSRDHLRSLNVITYELVSSDMFVLMSHWFDSQAPVLSEAAVAGLPILYCDDRLTVAAPPESTLLTRPDIGSLTAGIRRFVDPRWHAAIRSASRGLLKELTSRHTTETYISIYEGLIGVKNARTRLPHRSHGLQKVDPYPATQPYPVHAR